jgi:phosphate/sulfate permease
MIVPTASLTIADLIGGLAMSVGASPGAGVSCTHTVAFDAAQGVQALVVIAVVAPGLFTSMNQALIGALPGTGLTRGRETVQRKQSLVIWRDWAWIRLSPSLVVEAVSPNACGAGAERRSPHGLRPRQTRAWWVDA